MRMREVIISLVREPNIRNPYGFQRQEYFEVLSLKTAIELARKWKKNAEQSAHVARCNTTISCRVRHGRTFKTYTFIVQPSGWTVEKDRF